MRALLSRVNNVLRVVHGTSPVYRPVKIDTILAAVAECGIVGKINLIESDMDPQILLAQLVQKRVGGIAVADIYYSKHADKPTQRTCIAKEVIHVFDADDEKTTIPSVERLLDDLTVDGRLFTSPQMKSERRAIFGAIELLVPYEARVVLRGSWVEARYDHKTLAAAFVVPESIMKLALSDGYHEEIEKIRKELDLKMIA